MTTATVGKKNPKYKWEVLALLWVAHLLNQADRQVFNVKAYHPRGSVRAMGHIGSIATVFNLSMSRWCPSADWWATTAVSGSSREHPVLSVGHDVYASRNGFRCFARCAQCVATRGGEAFGPANYS